MKLGAGEHFEWLTMGRVNTGRVARDSSGGYVDQGRPLGVFLAEVVADLLQEGLLQVADPSPRDNLARVSLSEAGAARYSELCRRQRAPRPGPPVEQASAEAPADDRSDLP